MKTAPTYLYLLTLLYFIVSFIGIWHHELWLDEAHHWLIARDSVSFSELIQNTRAEGHPILWNILLYAITRFTTNPFGMQLLHLVISTSVVFLFLRKAPFPMAFKALFIFGYFMIFEYNLISRNYIFGLLFLFLACAVFKDRDRKFLMFCVFLALACNVHLMFSIIAFALFLTVIIEKIRCRQAFQNYFLMGCLVFGIGVLSIAVQIYYTNSDWLLQPAQGKPFTEKIGHGLGSLFKGLVCLPDFRTLHFWNSNFIVNSCRPLAAILAASIYLIPLLLFFKNRKTLFFIYVALIGTQIFFFLTQRSATRFHGMTFLIFIIGLWMEHYYPSENSNLKIGLESKRLTSFRKPILYGMLLIHFCSGIYAYTMDCLYPFTSAKDTVGFLKKQGLANREIVTTTCDGTLLSAYLERKIWFLCDGGYQSFCHWENQCSGKITVADSFAMLNDFMQSHEKAVFISYYPITNRLKPNVWVSLNEKIRIRFLKKLDQNIVDKTSYYIIELERIAK